MYNCHPNANALILSESYFIYKLHPAPSCDSRYCGTDWILWSKKNWKLSFYKSICRCWYREAIKVVHSVLQTLLLLLLPDFKSLYQGWIKNFYYRNCGVIQGFPALRKAVTTYVKKYRISLSFMFFTCVDKSNQLLTCHSPLAPLVQVDEWTAKLSRLSIQVVCRNFLELWRLSTHVFEPHWQTMRFKLS